MQMQQMPVERQSSLPENLESLTRNKRLQIKDNTVSFSAKYSNMLYGYMLAGGDHFPPVRCAYLL